MSAIDIAQQLGNAAWILTFPTLVAYLLTAGFVFARLERQHKEVWEALGEPRYVTPTIQSAIAFSRFLMTGRFNDLQDAKLAALGSTARAFAYLLIVLIGMEIVVVLFLAEKSPRSLGL